MKTIQFIVLVLITLFMIAMGLFTVLCTMITPLLGLLALMPFMASAFAFTTAFDSFTKG